MLGRRLLGRRWSRNECRVLKLAHRFIVRNSTDAFSLGDMAEARAYFDAVYTVVDANLPVSMQATGVAAVKGH